VNAADVDVRAIEAFLYREARLADEHDYAGWEALWADDGVYLVPAAGPLDATDRMAIIHDNRPRIATRIKQLQTGKRHAQVPPSRLRRIVANVEVLGPVDGADLAVEANFVLLEARPTGTTTWAGRVRYHLRLAGDDWRLVLKRVDLVDRPWDVPTLAFLI
jgi:3-phenylpropionate/cinnamic acid dioxygenase small subunit